MGKWKLQRYGQVRFRLRNGSPLSLARFRMMADAGADPAAEDPCPHRIVASLYGTNLRTSAMSGSLRVLLPPAHTERAPTSLSVHTFSSST